jgi:hypothetical protein
MVIGVLALIVACVGLAGVSAALAFRRGSQVRIPLTTDWIEEVSFARYRPMVRLLDDEDLIFLRAQRGYTPKMEARVRAQRCTTFLAYVRDLDDDFKRVCMALKILILQSPQDRPDLASAVVRNQVVFAYGKLAVRIRVFLYRWSLTSVDVSCLVRPFEQMRLELRRLAPAPTAAGF